MYLNIPVDRNAASSICGNFGGSLAVLSSESELEFVARYLVGTCSPAYVWLGGTVSVSGIASWDDGTTFTHSYVPWGVGEPRAGLTTIRHVTMVATAEGNVVWTTTIASDYRTILCEIPYQ